MIELCKLILGRIRRASAGGQCQCLPPKREQVEICRWNVAGEGCFPATDFHKMRCLELLFFFIANRYHHPQCIVVACTTSCVMTKLSCATVIIQREEHSASGIGQMRASNGHSFENLPDKEYIRWKWFHITLSIVINVFGGKPQFG